jgi:hypothetical protein
MRRFRGWALIGTAWVVTLGILLVLPTPAFAFVRYRTAPPAMGALGSPYAWGVRTVNLVGYTHGLPDMPVDQISGAMTAAVAAWSKGDATNATCSFLDLAISLEPVTSIPPDAVHDNVNTIAIRDGIWTNICSTMKDGTVDCHQPGELALTTVWSRACGEIVEADVEVNADTSSASQFQWADLDVTTANGFHDLQNALTHEMGHFIGLDHTCSLNSAAAVGEVDDLGNPVPDCGSATPAEMEATMYPSSEAGDVSKRTLSTDDQNGLCSIYPIGTDPMSCISEHTGGCAVAPWAGVSSSAPERRERWFGLLGCAVALGTLVSVRSRRR